MFMLVGLPSSLQALVAAAVPLSLGLCWATAPASLACASACTAVMLANGSPSPHLTPQLQGSITTSAVT